MARCGVCLTTDPAAMCEVGEVLLEAAAAHMLAVDGVAEDRA